ncbi:MAG: DUF4377 domain-containing protein [Deltaproteobacteria bacterium]|nr:DUF4377 domain-containing protein [Deltaproteobacteria bacterium]
MRLAALTALAPALLAGCPAADVRVATVEPLLAPCARWFAWGLCLVATEEGGQPELLDEGIDGFQFRWGVKTTLRYRVDTIDDPPQDGSSIRRVLVDVIDIDEDAVGPSFDLVLPVPDGDPWFEASTTSGEVDLAGERVLCAPSLCEQLVGAVAGTVTFELTGQDATPLRATAFAPQ